MSLQVKRRPRSKDKKFFVGLDVSLTDTGLAILSPNGADVCKLSIPSNTNESDIRRIIQTTEKVILEISQNCILADYLHVFIEGYAYSANMGKARTRAELTGHIKCELYYKRAWGIYEVPPTNLKKFVTGSGRASKDDMIRGVFKKWGYHATNDNIADAYALAKYGQAFINRTERLQATCLQMPKLYA